MIEFLSKKYFFSTPKKHTKNILKKMIQNESGIEEIFTKLGVIEGGNLRIFCQEKV